MKKVSKAPAQHPDPSHDIWRQFQKPLDSIFNPKSVAVIGASEKPRSVGHALISNLTRNAFKGKVFPVNPKRETVLGMKAYPSLSSLPEKVELAVIATPADTVPGVIRECVAQGVKGVIIISAGFKELGKPGEALEREIMAEAGKGKIRIVGPNCLGVMNPVNGLNATFASQMAKSGNVAFISQSGALCTSILDWSLREGVGFSAFVSIGSMLDVGWADLLDYLGDDPHTKSILIYMETIGDARSFLSVAREVALTKPIIVLKAGRTEAAAKAALSHTGSIAGSDGVLDAAFQRSGVLRVERIEELFDMADILAKQPRPLGPALSILTNAGGPAVLATDAFILAGGRMAELSEETLNALNAFLPAHWSHANPIDILGDADPERYARSISLTLDDPKSDGLLVMLTPQAMTDPTQTAEALKKFAKTGAKPILASWMGGREVAESKKILSDAGIPVFPYPDEAARAFQTMWRYSSNLKSLYETPHELCCAAAANASNRAKVFEILEAARLQKRFVLSEWESKTLLRAYGIPAVKTELAESEDAAILAAESMGYPVVLKLHSHTLTHKSDVGGVKLNLKNAEEARDAYRAIERAVAEKSEARHFQGVTVQPMLKLAGGCELVIGSTVDAQFGPVILFGAGGELVEIFKDYALALPPLNSTLARRLVESTKIFNVLKGFRGRAAVNLDRLGEILARFSQLVMENPRIREIDINPILAAGESLTALDARVILHETAVADVDLPRAAIRSYPSQYISDFKMKNGCDVVIRPIRPEDEPLMAGFHETLSERSVRQRYFHAIGLNQRTAHERLVRVCFHNYDRQIALVADGEKKDKSGHEIFAVARLIRLHGTADAEFSMIVNDRYQKQGLGAELLARLLNIGRKEGIQNVFADILPDNLAMQKICKNQGFSLQYDPEGPVLKAQLTLGK